MAINSQEFKTINDDIRKLKTLNDMLTDTLKELYKDTEMKHMLHTTTVIIKKYSTQVSLLTNAIFFAPKGACHTFTLRNSKNIRRRRKSGDKHKTRLTLPNQI